MAEIMMALSEIPPDLLEYFEPVRLDNKKSVFTVSTQASDWEYCKACKRLYVGPERSAIRVEEVEVDGATKTRRHCLCGRCDSWVQHFAAYPERLIEPMILAGCPATVCAKCGAPHVRVTEDTTEYAQFKVEEKSRRGRMRLDDQESFGLTQGKSNRSVSKSSITVGFKTTCTCNAGTSKGIVLDPFFGSGTTGLVAQHLGRDWVGIDLNADYAEVATARTSRPAMVALPLFESLVAGS